MNPKILFVRNADRFRFLASAFASREWECVHIGPPDAPDLPGTRTLRYQLGQGSTAGVFKLAERLEGELARGKDAADLAARLKGSGFVPDLIIGHPGWGEMGFLSEVYPGAKQIQIGEWYYYTLGGDLDFDPEFDAPTFADQCRARAWNATLATSALEADRIVSPTRVQAGTFPEVLRPRISVIHEGIDTDVAKPGHAKSLMHSNGIELSRETPVV